jgi:hypothetical protein
MSDCWNVQVLPLVRRSKILIATGFNPGKKNIGDNENPIEVQHFSDNKCMVELSMMNRMVVVEVCDATTGK